MNTAQKKQPISVAEYLSGELIGKQKHEYVDGTVYGMPDATVRHCRIATNVTGTLGSQLRGKPCEVFNSDMKIRIRQSRSVRFYYPDVSVTYQPNPDDDLFQDRPTVVVEVLSDSTRRVDEYEKREAYLTINSLDWPEK
jgi:Uma2 family endonuclease